MNKPKISKGPWRAKQHEQTQLFVIGQEATFHIGEIARVWGEGNAKAVTALPQLLTALEAIHSCLGPINQDVSLAAYETKQALIAAGYTFER